jgi:hypothetical protein
MWWMAAAAAAPYVMAALQKKPSAPGAPALQAPPDRSAYSNQILSAGFNPNDRTLGSASSVAEDAVNRVLARQGLAGSSIGGQLHATTQADIANKWLENELNRKISALSTVNNIDLGRVNAMNQNAKAMYDYGMDRYNMQNQQNAGQIQGISGLMSMGANMYGQSQIADRLAQNNEMNKNYLANMYAPQPSYGTPAPGGYSLGNYQLPVNQNYMSGGF